MRQTMPPDPADLLETRVTVGGADVSLAELLRSCLDGEPRTDDWRAARRAFVEAGLGALRSEAAPWCWIQVGLAIAPGRFGAPLYGRVAALARALLRRKSVRGVFFMHKPPGMRLRFETRGPDARPLADELYERVARWQREGLVDGIVPGVYEPETLLFGGPASMRSVHELFTLDSLAWLDYHALGAGNGRAVEPAWVLSFAMLRSTFSAIGITDWEDLEVWDRVRSKTGRRLPDAALSLEETAAVAAEVRAGWAAAHELLGGASAPVRRIAERFRRDLEPVAARWNAEYFATRCATVGPRAAAALVTIFHWNRAGLASTRQQLFAEALATRETV